jgi:hypothetical protein
VKISISLRKSPYPLASATLKGWVDADGKNQRNLTNNPAADSAPSWFDPTVLSVSPAGRHTNTWGKVKTSK